MKLKLLLLFAVFQAGFSFAQFDNLNSGTYKTATAESYIYIYQISPEQIEDYPDLTPDQRKNVVFGFSFDSEDIVGASVAIQKGNTFVSVVNEYTPEYTFVFKTVDNLDILEVIDRSGKKILFEKMEVPAYYYDDETYSDYEGYSDEESGDVDSYGDEEMSEALSLRGYSRSDGAELAVIFTDETFVFALHIPATKSCSEILLEGELVGGGEEGLYVYNDPDGKFVLNLIEMENTMQFECAKGDCFDKKGKCGVWEEVFIQGD